MKPRLVLAALLLCLAAGIYTFGQGTVVINDPTIASDAPKYELTASEKRVMDDYVLPGARVRLREDGCEEEIVISGRFHGAFTRAGAKQTFVFYQFCQTGNGLGTAGLAILENGKMVASFVAPQAGWTMDSAVLPDVNQNGLNEIALYYSGGMHQGEGGTGVDIFEYSAGSLKGIGWYQSDGYKADGPVFGYKVTVNPGKTPVFFKQKYLQNSMGKWRVSGKVLPLKLGEVIGAFEKVK